MFSFLFFSIGRAWQGFWRNAAMSLAATATMTLMLLLLAGFWIIQAGFLARLSYVEDKVGVVADLEDGTTALARPGAPGASRCSPGVKTVEYISKDEALRRYREERANQGQSDFMATSPKTHCPQASRSSRATRGYRTVADYLEEGRSSPPSRTSRHDESP